MARIFNAEIFRGVINASSATGYYSDPRFNELLGQADDLILQVIMDSNPNQAVSTTVTAQYQSTDDNSQDAMWNNVSNFKAVCWGSAGNCPTSGMKRMSVGDPQGALGRVIITCDSNINGVAVRVIVCGRSFT